MSALTGALNRIMAWLQENSPVCASAFNPGLSLETVKTYSSNLPFQLPDEVYELYQWRNGIDDRWGIFVYHQLLDLDAALYYSQGINEWIECLRSEDGESAYPSNLFAVFEFHGEFFALESNSKLSNSCPIFQIGCEGDLTLAFTSLTNMMLSLAECYETGVYAVTSDGWVEVKNEIKFGAIRRKYNPGAVHSLYAEGW